MLAMRTLVSASLVVGVVGSARAQVAPSDPPASDGSGAPLLPPSAVAPTPPPVKPPPTGTFQIGVGYRSDEGFGVDARVAQSDLFHTGNVLVMDAAISERVQHFALRFVDPHLANDRLTLSAEIYNDRRLLGDTGIWREAVGADVSLSTHIADHATAWVGYRFENVQGTGNLAWLRAGTTYSTLNTPMAPTRGTTVGADVGVADNAFGSDYDLVRADAWFSTHQPLGPFIFHTGGRFAAIGTTDGNGVPFTEQLFFNGSSDLRGFGFADGPGAYSPGNVLGMWRTELELPV